MAAGIIRRTLIATLLAVAIGSCADPGGPGAGRRQRPGGPVLVVTDPGRPVRAATTREILRAEGLNEFAVADIGHARRADARRPTRSSCSPQTDAHRRPGRRAHHLGPGRRQPHRDAPRRAASPGCSAWAPTPATSPTATCRSHARPARHHRRDDAVPRHRGPLDGAGGATRGRDALLDARHADGEPGGDAAQRRRAGGQAAAFTYDLARSVVYTRQGNPAWAGQERDGELDADPLRRPVLRRPASARLGRPQQGRDPAGRRAAAPAGQPRSPR